MYKRIDEVMRKILEYNNFQKLVVYTNGTIVPKAEKAKYFKNEKVIFKISNYGTISRNVAKLEEFLTNNNINFVTEKVTRWQDCAKIQKFERDEKITKNIFGNCCENQGLTVLHGKMYLCPFAAHATNLDAIEKYPNDIIDTKNVESGNFKKKIEDLYFNREFIGACNYCNGRDHNVAKVEAGVQTKEVLKYEKINN